MFTVEEILEYTGGKLIRGSPKNRVSGVSIDSRTIKPNELFVAIKGGRFNGYDFIAQAAYKRAGAILFSDNRYRAITLSCKWAKSTPIVKVKNTVCALGALAHHYRVRFKIPVVAITGSNGKTTTKEMLSAIVAQKFNVLYNPGTQNNHIGVSLAILKLRPRHNFAVIEIGANHKGEIDRLSWIIQPAVGVITNIGPSHLEFFKSLRGVFTAKLELIRNLAENGKIIINKDDRFLSQLRNANLQIVTFGLNRFSDFYGQIIQQTEKKSIFLLNGKQRIELKAIGRHNVYNALASIACARNFGISYKEIKNALASFKAPAMRMQMLNVNNSKIINDCYNSNPDSLRHALDFLNEYSTLGNKIVVCGDMLELGKSAEKLHLDMGKRIAEGKVNFLITVGPLSRNVAWGAHSKGMPEDAIRTFRNTTEAAKFLRRLMRDNDVVLIKGSRAMQMENIVKCFTNSSIH